MHAQHRRSAAARTLLAVAASTLAASALAAGERPSRPSPRTSEAAARTSRAATSPTTPDHHELAVTLEPPTSTLAGTDRLTIPWRRSLAFRLHAGMQFSLTDTTGQDLTPRARRLREPGSGHAAYELALPRALADDRGLVTLVFGLKGVVADPVTEEPSLHFVTGDRTTGIISTDGAFLTGSTGWYPDTRQMATFDATLDVPEAWKVASQGALEPASASAGPGRALFRYRSAVPSDGLALSAGPYVVETLQHGRTTISTYLFPAEAELADTFLEAAGRFIDRLERTLGPYPHPKFDIVENFFTTGYGFPSYTLLGRDVIRMGPRALRPGYLDHEIAHCWWGNHVYVDAAQGNWCEGLASYTANYLSAELESEAAALDARRKVSQKYSVDVRPEADAAPAAFVEKADDDGASIGYGKVSMAFHQLRRTLGDDTFWAGLREVVARHGGRRASWSDLRHAFEAVSGRELGGFFAQWIERAGLPQLRLADVREEGTLRAVVAQEGTPYDLSVTAAVTLVDGRTTRHEVAISGSRTELIMGVEGGVSSLTLDPDWHVPRRLARADLPPSLQRTLVDDPEGAPPLCVYPWPTDAGVAPSARQQRLKELAEQAASAHGGRAMAAKDVAEIEFASAPVLALGGPAENRWVARLRPGWELLDLALADDGTFRAGPRRWSDPAHALLVTVPHPYRDGATATVFAPLGDAALEAARFVFFHAWDTWVALESGRARDRHVAWPEESATSVTLAPPQPPASAGARMVRLVDRLTRPRLEGRDAGTAGELEAALLLADEMASAGLLPAGDAGHVASFSFVSLDLEGRPALRVPTEARAPRFVPIGVAHPWVKLPDSIAATMETRQIAPAPARQHQGVHLPRGLVFVGEPRPMSFAGLDLADAAAVLVDRRPLDAGGRGPTESAVAARIEDYVKLLIEARLRNAAALVVIRPGEPSPFFPALCTYPSQASSREAERFEKARAALGARGVARLAAGMRARSPVPADLPPIPLLFAGDELLLALEQVRGTTRGARSWEDEATDARMSVFAERIIAHDIVGLLGRTTSHLVRPVLLSAHFDGIGFAADGRVNECAVDNAAGVAVVLEVARRLAADPPPGQVFVALTSGEEWGLQGARALARRWPADRTLQAVINVDSVGQAGKPLHVIGGSREPQLAGVVTAQARAAGLEIGKDIDVHADRDGSDHWPWVLAGVPAVSLFQADYAVVNTPADTKALLDADALERLADALEDSVRALMAPPAS
jgi:hypothetical protein